MTMSLFLRNLVFTLVVPASAGVYVPLLLARGSSQKSGVAMLAALVLFVIGAGLYLSSVWNFGARGRGTPLPIDAPKELVIRGPNRHTRNPMYVGLLSALLGWLVLFQTGILAAYLLVGSVAVYLFVIGYEEPHLRELFGAQYDAYKSRVPRWLPRFPRRPDA